MVLRKKILAYYIKNRKSFALVASTYGFEKYNDFEMKPIDRNFFGKKTYYGKPIFRRKSDFDVFLKKNNIEPRKIKYYIE